MWLTNNDEQDRPIAVHTFYGRSPEFNEQIVNNVMSCPKEEIHEAVDHMESMQHKLRNPQKKCYMI